MSIEELKGMSQEDLVRRIQELEEEKVKLKESEEYYFNKYQEMKDKFDQFRNAVKSVVLLVDKN